MTTEILFFIGATFILKYGAPTKPIRDFFARWNWGASLFNCALCLGFWVGVASIPFLNHDLVFLFPFVSAAASWFGDIISQNLVALKNFLDKEED